MNSNKKSKALPLTNELRVVQTIVSSTHVSRIIRSRLCGRRPRA
jgi:hypothetical protein